MYQAVDDGAKLSAPISGKFYIIFDIRESAGFPKDFLSTLSYLSKNKQANVGLRAVVGTNVMFRAIYRIVQSIRPNLTENFVLCPDMDDAIRQIERIETQNSRES